MKMPVNRMLRMTRRSFGIQGLTPPVIGGLAEVGAVLDTVTAATWSEVVTVTYQWYRDGTPIIGATSEQYTTTEDDLGATLLRRDTGAVGGVSVSQISNAIGPILAAPHRAWRIDLVTNCGSPTQSGIAGLKMYEAEGGPDVSGDATAYIDGGAGSSLGGVANLFDGNPGTSWSRGATGGTHFVIDFGADPANWKAIAYVELTADDSFATHMTNHTKMSWTDDDPAGAATYTEVVDQTYGDTWLLTQTRRLPEAAPAAGLYRVWRLLMANNNGGNIMSAAEIELLSGGVDIIPAGHSNDATLRLSITNAGLTPITNATDNSLNTAWSTDLSGTTNQTFDVIFPEPVSAALFRVTVSSTASVAGYQSRAPKDVTRSASNDRITFTAGVSTSWTGWGDGVPKTV